MANAMAPIPARAPNIKAESVGPMGMGTATTRDPRSMLSTYIYDYFLKTRQPEIAQAIFNNDPTVQTKERPKPSPSGRDVNGAMDTEPKDETAKKIERMPAPDLDAQLHTESFLQDWFCTFWDVWQASRGNGNPTNTSASSYLQQVQRMKANPMMMNNPMRNQFMNTRMGGNNIQKQALNNIQMSRMGQAMNFPGNQMGQQGPDGQRPQSPSLSGDNAPSPSKRPRVDGFNPGMGGNPNGTGQVMNGQANIPLNADPSMMMANQLPGAALMTDGGENRAPNPQGGALADYQMQLMLLEQQNKRRLLMARQEQEGVSGPPGNPQPVMQGQMPFPPPPGMSPRRTAGQSPSPHDGLKRNHSQMTQSPRPDNMVSRGSPVPGMFDPSQNPQMGAQPQFLMNGAMKGPGAMMQGGGPNFPGGPNGMKAQMGMRPGGVPYNPQQMNGPFAQNPQQQQQQQQPPQNGNPQANTQGGQPPNSMPPPQAPVNTAAGRSTNPSSPQPPAPPTPNQTNKAGPKQKKETAKKEAPNRKATQKAKPGATPSSEQHTPPPSTPVTPHPPPGPLSGKSNAQPNSNPPSQNAPNGAPPQQPFGPPQTDMNAAVPDNSSMQDPNMPNMDDFGLGFGDGHNEILDGFDFDTFLQTDPASEQAFDFSTFPGMGDGMEMNADN